MEDRGYIGWAKMTGHPWWPAIVYNTLKEVPPSLMRSDVKLRLKSDQVAVLYLGDFMWGVVQKSKAKTKNEVLPDDVLKATKSPHQRQKLREAIDWMERTKSEIAEAARGGKGKKRSADEAPAEGPANTGSEEKSSAGGKGQPAKRKRAESPTRNKETTQASRRASQGVAPRPKKSPPVKTETDAKPGNVKHMAPLRTVESQNGKRPRGSSTPVGARSLNPASECLIMSGQRLRTPSLRAGGGIRDGMNRLAALLGERDGFNLRVKERMLEQLKKTGGDDSEEYSKHHRRCPLRDVSLEGLVRVGVLKAGARLILPPLPAKAAPPALPPPRGAGVALPLQPLHPMAGTLLLPPHAATGLPHSTACMGVDASAGAAFAAVPTSLPPQPGFAQTAASADEARIEPCGRVRVGDCSYDGVEDMLEERRQFKKMSRREKTAWTHVRYCEGEGPVPHDAPPLSEYILQELSMRRRKEAWQAAAKTEAWETLADLLEQGDEETSSADGMQDDDGLVKVEGKDTQTGHVHPSDRSTTRHGTNLGPASRGTTAKARDAAQPSEGTKRRASGTGVTPAKPKEPKQAKAGAFTGGSKKSVGASKPLGSEAGSCKTATPVREGTRRRVSTQPKGPEVQEEPEETQENPFLAFWKTVDPQQLEDSMEGYAVWADGNFAHFDRDDGVGQDPDDGSENVSASRLRKTKRKSMRVGDRISEIQSRKLSPHTLCICEQYGVSGGSSYSHATAVQPFTVKVHPDVPFLCDLHAHLADSEIIGFLAGRFDRDAKCLYIQAPFPCRATARNDDGSTDVEMDPGSEIEMRDVIDKNKMKIMGWYHSHPTFQPEPSLIDIENQHNYQTLFKDEETSLEPFTGLIVGTYDDAMRCPASIFRYFHVRSVKVAPRESVNFPMLLEVQLAKADRGPAAQCGEAATPLAEGGTSDTKVDEALGSGVATMPAGVEPAQAQAQAQDINHVPGTSGTTGSHAGPEGVTNVTVAEEHKDAASRSLEQETNAFPSTRSVEPRAGEAEGSDGKGSEAVRTAEGLGSEAAMDSMGHAHVHRVEHANGLEADQQPSAPQVPLVSHEVAPMDLCAPEEVMFAMEMGPLQTYDDAQAPMEVADTAMVHLTAGETAQVEAPSSAVKAPNGGHVCSAPPAVDGPLDLPPAPASAAPSHRSDSSQEPPTAADVPASPSMASMPDSSVLVSGHHSGTEQVAVVHSVAPEEYPASVYNAVRTGQLQLPPSEETWRQIQHRFLGSAGQGCLGFRCTLETVRLLAHYYSRCGTRVNFDEVWRNGMSKGLDTFLQMFKKGFGRKSSRGSFDDIPLPTPQTSSTNLHAVQAPVPFTPQNTSAAVPIETRLQQKTDLLDELRKTLPLDVRVPTIVVVGGRGSGKSSVLETLTGVPFPRGPNGVTTRAVKTVITADPTATSEFALVSERDGAFREGARRVGMDELQGVLAQLFRPKPTPVRASSEGEEDVPVTPVIEQQGPIFVRVVRPSGPSYHVVDLPPLTEENEDVIEKYLSEDPRCLILPVLTVHEVFDHPGAVRLAKKVDPDGRRIIGVVTKIDQVEKDHHIVEKLQMTSRREVSLPLGYVAVRLMSVEETSSKMSRAQLLDLETQFFATNPLLRGLRPERWGAVTLKKLVVEYQSNFISHRIPDLSKQVRQEIELVDNEIRETNSTFSHPQHFFTKVVSDVGSMAFEFHDLAVGARTRDDQTINLGARFYAAVSNREAEARKRLPSCMSPAFAEYLKKELAQVPGMVNGNDALSHPVFTKAVREHCGPVLKDYASGLVADANKQLRDVMNALVDERFSEFPRLVEALRTDFEELASAKVEDAEKVISRLLEAELSWIFVSDADQQQMVKDVQALLSKKSTKPTADLWSEDGEEEPQVIRPVVSRSESERDIENFQATLDTFIRFFTRRLFYTVPMNIRNVILSEFRKDMVEVVVSKYNNDDKMRTLMSVELWLDQLQSQRSEKKAALIEVLSKLDLLV